MHITVKAGDNAMPSKISRDSRIEMMFVDALKWREVY